MHRVDVTKVGSLSQHSMKLLPIQKSKSGVQKCIVGDADGQLYCFSLKKGILTVL